MDYRFLDSLEDRGVFFVTRLKDKAVFSGEAEFSAPKGNILADEMICLPGSGKSAKALRLFRRVVVWDEVEEREIVLLTNNLKLAASTIAAICKSRWQIELFFKALKQNLKIKTFVGTSPNAVRIQIWTEYNLYCAQVFHAINGAKCPFWQFSSEKYCKRPFLGRLRVNFLHDCCYYPMISPVSSASARKALCGDASSEIKFTPSVAYQFCTMRWCLEYAAYRTRRGSASCRRIYDR